MAHRIKLPETRIRFFETRSHRSPVEDYILRQPKRDQAVLTRTLDLLVRLGFHIHRLSDVRLVRLTPWLFELRVKGDAFHRIMLLRERESEFVLVHAYAGKPWAGAEEEARTAQRRIASWVARHSETADRERRVGSHGLERGPKKTAP